MSSLLYGTDEGYAEPGLPGQTNPFPFTNILNRSIANLTANRMAGLANQSADYLPSWNDIMYAYRMVYTNRSFGTPGSSPKKLLSAFSPDAMMGYSLQDFYGGYTPGPNGIDVTGKVITFPGNQNPIKSVDVQSTPGLTTIPIGSGNNIFVQMLTATSGDSTALPKLATKVTDANNYLRLAVISSTTLRLDRLVAGVGTTEQDFTLSAGTFNRSGNAIGIRIEGANVGVFLNGKKLGTVALSGAAQALAGTAAGVHTPTVATASVDCFEAWSLV